MLRKGETIGKLRICAISRDRSQVKGRPENKRLTIIRGVDKEVLIYRLILVAKISVTDSVGIG